MLKRILTALMIFVVVLGTTVRYESSGNIQQVPISVSVNNQFINTEDDSFYYMGVAYGPVRTIAMSMGARSIEWNLSSRSARVSGDGLNAEITTDSSRVKVNGKTADVGYPAILHNGRLSLPIGIIVGIMNGECNWDPSTLHMQIYKKGVDIPDEHLSKRDYNEDDVVWLSRIINAESEGESLTGKIAVGNVVLNRVKDEYYPNTIYGVIFDRNHGVQFEPVMNGTVYNKPSSDSILAAKLALEGESHVGNSLFFCNPRTSTNSWIMNNRPFYSMIGNHAFFL